MKLMEIWDKYWPILITVAAGLIVGLLVLPKFFR